MRDLEPGRRYRRDVRHPMLAHGGPRCDYVNEATGRRCELIPHPPPEVPYVYGGRQHFVIAPALERTGDAGAA